ncbi:glycosyltransferase family 39 protein [Actinoplanes sp. KI2]|uniref:glycosyltransferase family 39 protein n=1 Tax=Actinoplanes sp. KI2 TaxID=2983315 RepID=UPI0021D57E9F|nr:glycosyltransferase family 39 protein [Actinoplanes sp. KI2]MCU7728596.1 glycosyltransferase family 39 protein [Actinoplanes sp. KI2]
MTLTLDPASALETPRPAGPRRRWLGDPIWARPALWALLAATAVLYLWDLGASGWANEFYAASAQAGSQSWKAWLFASLDAGNAITVDKPPAAMWVMGLSMRIFGVNSWSLLVPEALMGVASVALLYAAVRRWFGPVAGLLAGAALAVTPVAVLMFRFDNPDALLVLLMTAAAYATVRAVEKGSWKWLALTGVLIGFGFLTKMMQAFLVLPGFALVYLLAAPIGLWRRVRDLLIAGAALVVSGGWFVLLVSLWPASSRPYIAGSTNNTLWQLAIGYNGLGRIFGGEGNPGGSSGGPGGGGRGFGGGMFGGQTGITRMFGDSFGLEISWLLPAALVALVALLVGTVRAPRTDRTRAAAILWGAWTVVTALTFSYMSGIAHEYYSVALAPGIAALVGIGATVLWGWRSHILARAGLAAMVAVTAAWDFELLGRVSWAPVLRWFVLVGGLIAAAALLVPGSLLRRAGVVAVAALAVVTTGAAGAAWGVGTAGTAHTGSTPSSGPAGVSTGGRGGFPGGGFPGRGSSQRGAFPGGAFPGGAFPGGAFPDGAFPGGSELPSFPGGGTGQNGRTGAPQGSPRGGGQTVSSELVGLLKATGTRWAAATNGSMEAAPLQLASGRPVMAIGGFTGSDPSPTLAEFQAYVKAGEVRYYLGGGMGGGFGRGGGGGSISEWVEQNFTSTTVGGSTVYDLSKPKTAA